MESLEVFLRVIKYSLALALIFIGGRIFWAQGFDKVAPHLTGRHRRAARRRRLQQPETNPQAPFLSFTFPLRTQPCAHLTFRVVRS
jgi:hypothetical protein